MAHAVAQPIAASTGPDEFPRWRRSVGFIALGAGLASFAMNFWVPFLPIYMRELGAGSAENALFWVAISMSGVGFGRILTGPIWGALADRYGRKRMYVRALYAATLTTLVAVVAQAPWHVAAAWICQGLFSGFIPAAVALTSVSVPQSRLSSGLGTVQAAQYAGTTVGPALGALLAATFGLRGAILTGALLPAVAATLVLVLVPRDPIAPRPARAVARTATRTNWRTTLGRDFSVQFGLGLLLYFIIFAVSQLVRTAAPVAIGEIEGTDAATGATGLAFAAAGLASVGGALLVARWVNRPGRLRTSLTLVIAVSAVAHVLLGLAGSVVVFTLWFALISLAQGAMMPATNTIIAASVPAERRGSAFGIASSVQATAFIVGPMGAAYFAGHSLAVGFTILGLGLVAAAAATFVFLREPDLSEGQWAVGSGQSGGASPQPAPQGKPLQP